MSLARLVFAGMEHFSHLDTRACYINAASRTPLPARVLAAGQAAMQLKARTPWSIGDTERCKDEVRALFAELLCGGVTARDVALMSSCSFAMSVAAHNMRDNLRARPVGRRRVLVLADQNPSNVMPWQALCADEGGELLVVPPPADGDWAREIVAHVASGTVVACALPPCHWCDGSVVDLGPIGAACRSHGAALVVDGTQSLGAGHPLDPVALGVSFLACSVHKWLLSPYGACLCYVAPALWRRAATLDHHDRNRAGADEVECLPMDAAGYPSAFQEGARRLDGGGRPSYIVMPMLREALTILVRELTVPRVVEYVGRYTAAIGSRAAQLGFIVPARHAPGIIGLRPAAGMPDAAAIVKSLAARTPKPVLVSERLGAIRVSPHLYNTPDDLEQLLDGLREAVHGAPRSRV